MTSAGGQFCKVWTTTEKVYVQEVVDLAYLQGGACKGPAQMNARR